MTNNEAVNWLINVRADIGKSEHRALWHYEQALAEIIELLSAEPMESHHRYEQGVIEGRVRMRTEMLKAIKNIVGDEVWNGI